jgi:uncharacterized membrane protein
MYVMTWQLLVIISILFFSFSTILQKILLRNDKTDPMAFSIFFQLFVGIIIGMFGFVTLGLSFPNVIPLFFNLIIMIIVYALGNIFLFKALQKIDVSEFTVIFSGRTVCTIIASSLLLKEGLNFHQYIGMILILISIIFVTVRTFSFGFSKQEFYALASAVCFGLATTNDRFLLGHFQLYTYVAMAFIIPALCTIPIYPSSISHMSIFLKSKFLIRMFVLCFLYAISAICFFSALQIGNNSSQIASINQVTVIFTVLLSIFILKERENIFKKMIGAVLSFIGIILLG